MKGWGESQRGPDMIHRLRSIAKDVTVDLLVLGYLVAWLLQNILTTNLLYDKVSENFGPDVSTPASQFDKEERIQQLVSQLNMYIKLIQNLPSILFVLFMGSWSDINGRKLPLILPFVGSLVATLICLMNAYLWWLSPVHILMSAVPRAMTGGTISMMMAAYSYVSDISTEEMRTSRLAMLDFMFILSQPIGLCLSDVLFENFGYCGVYGISSLLFVVCIIFAVGLLKETRGHFASSEYVDKFAGKSGQEYTKLFALKNVKDTVGLFFKGSGDERNLMLLILAICLMNFICCTTGLEYLFTKRKFGWTYSQFIHLNIASFLILGFGTAIILPILSKKMGIEECFLGLLGCASRVSGCIIQGFAYHPWHLYLASVVCWFAEAPMTIARSKVSKLVVSEDFGKIFSVVASWEAVVPLISNPIYTLTYNATIDIFPGAIFLITGTIYFVCGVIFTFLFLRFRNSKKPSLQEYQNLG